MLNTILAEAKQEVKFGYLKKKHPFRYPVLASVSDGFPNQRTVVLRDTSDAFELVFYTDSRSNKIQDFKVNPHASALFYHPKKLLQVTISGSIKLITSGKAYNEYWSRVQGRSKNDFITEKAPGSKLSNPEEVSYLNETNYFCVLKLVPSSIEYLRLKRPNHIRAVFKKERDWEGQFLNP